MRRTWIRLLAALAIALVLLIALLFSGAELRAAASPAVVIFLLCELIVFQPNVYDNNKLLYISYAFFCIASASFVSDLAETIRSRALRAAALALLLVLCTNAAVFTLTREYVSGTGSCAIRLFSSADAEAARFIRSETDADSLFLTDSNHNNAVAALTGRSIFCGSPSYLFYHGLDYEDRLALERRLLTDSAAFEDLHGELGIDYVYLGPYERGLAGSIAPYLEETYPVVFSSGNVSICQIK